MKQYVEICNALCSVVLDNVRYIFNDTAMNNVSILGLVVAEYLALENTSGRFSSSSRFSDVFTLRSKCFLYYISLEETVIVL